MEISNLLQDFFRLRGVHQMFGGSIFEGRNEILPLGKIWGIFQKHALKLIKNLKIIEKIREKMQIFFRNF